MAAAVWSSPSSCPAGMVYFGSDDNYLYAVDPPDGAREVEVQDRRQVILFPCVAGRTWSTSASMDSYFYAVDAQNGTEKWKFQTGNQIHQLPPPSADGVVCFGSLRLLPLRPLYAETGAEKWNFKTNDAQRRVTSHLRRHGLLRRGGARCGAGHLALRDGSPERCGGMGVQDGHTGFGVKIESFPAISDGVAYFSGSEGALYAVDIQSGQQNWQVSDRRRHFFSTGVLPGRFQRGGLLRKSGR